MNAAQSFRFLPLVAALLLSACSTGPKILEPRDGPPDFAVDIDAIPDAVPRWEPRTSAGNPPFYEVYGQRYFVLPDVHDYVQKGVASWYGAKFHGQRTSNGEIYDMLAMTAAHKTLPIPCYVRVTNLENNRSIVVRVNDRGPFHDDRLIDLSYVAAAKLGIVENGTGFVEVRAIETASASAAPPNTDANPGIFLQVGAFSDRRNAQRFLDTIAALNLHRTRIQQNRSNGKEIYRVQLGPIADAEEAGRIAERLNAQGITETRFVTDAAASETIVLQ